MTIYGWDMSHYDSPGLGSAIADGISFVTHKAGGDSSSGDAELAGWWSGARGLPTSVLLGTYWVPRPDLYSSPSGEADRFLDTLDARCPSWRDRDAFILQVDAEIWNGDSATKPSKAYLKTLCDRLVYETKGAYRPIVYASAGQYGSSLSGLGYPLWNARYPYSNSEGFKAAYARAGGDSGKGWGSYSGQTPVIWQYTSSASIGGQSTSDANAFRGSLAELKEIVSPMAITDADAQKLASKISTDLNNPDSGIAQGTEERDSAALERAIPYADGGPGARIEERGWGEVSPWGVLMYLFEMIAADPVTLADGTSAAGSVSARLARIEEKLGILQDPPTPPAS